jgi:IS4 transposase
MYRTMSIQAGFRRGHFKIKTKRVLLLDATMVSLCLKLFDWAHYRQSKGAIKLHVLLDYESCLPIYVNMTDGKVHETTGTKLLELPKDSVVVADRGYIDFDTFDKWNRAGNNFVVRLKAGIQHKQVKERELSESKAQNILIDEEIELSEAKSWSKYPRKLRRVAVFDDKNCQTIELVTNNFSWTAETIAELYKQRWMIEIFFKELKQLLKIKTFVGTSANAVLIQIWTAMLSILILKYLKAIAKYNWSLSNLVSFLRLNLFVKIELNLWLDKPFEAEDSGYCWQNLQLKLF